MAGNNSVVLWVINMYNQCENDETVYVNVDFVNKKVEVFRDNNKYRVEKGVSYCHPKTSFGEKRYCYRLCKT